MRNWIRNNRGLIAFILCFGLFRTAVADWNPIPSGSMRPNIVEGDVVLINRLAYDVKLPLTDVVLFHHTDPKRGDIVTFSSPKDGIKLIKRIIGLPGDRVEMRAEVLYINGTRAEYTDAQHLLEPMEDGNTVPATQLTESLGDTTHRMQVLSSIQARDTFGPIEVPSGHYLMLGDNRDNSADSRYFGFVPENLLIGKAHRILVSAAIKDNWMPRLGRFGLRLE